jgi:predicted transcriptional regulator
MSRDEIIKLIERPPANATEAGVMEELCFRLQVEKGIKDLDEGRVLTHAELKSRISDRRRSAGR